MQANIKHQQPYDVYCGRGYNGLIPISPGQYGWLGNPIKKGIKCPECREIHQTGGSTLSCYEVYLRSRLSADQVFAKHFDNLLGKVLGCFCIPAPCHTTVILKVLEERINKP